MESDPAVRKTNPEFVVIIRSCADCILKSCLHSGFVFRVNGGVKAFVWNRTLTGIEAIQAKSFIRYMKNLPCGEIRCPTADVGKALRFRKVCLFPPQFLCQQLLLGDVHCGTNKSLENSLFHDGESHGANIAQLPVGSNNSLN